MYCHWLLLVILGHHRTQSWHSVLTMTILIPPGIMQLKFDTNHSELVSDSQFQGSMVPSKTTPTLDSLK